MGEKERKMQSPSMRESVVAKEERTKYKEKARGERQGESRGRAKIERGEMVVKRERHKRVKQANTNGDEKSIEKGSSSPSVVLRIHRVPGLRELLRSGLRASHERSDP